MLEGLACPETHQRLTLVPREAAEARLGGPLAALRPERPGTPKPFGPTPEVLLREDGGRAYPFIDGVPILLRPEALGLRGEAYAVDLSDRRYAEAYQEMEHYNAIASQEAVRMEASGRDALLEATDADRATFPAPRNVWIDFVCDGVEEWDAYAHLAPVAGKRVLQVGGKGAHAVKFLVAGAAEAWALSPMLGEARYARALANVNGVAARLHCVVAIAEELPFVDGTFDGVFSPSCVHHMSTEQAFPELARILVPGGRFAAVEPWRAPFYALGTKIFGKQEANPYCRPLTSEQVRPLFTTFPDARVIHHGTFTRYPLLALEKIGVPVTTGAAWRIIKADDAIASVIGMRKWGSGVTLTGTR